MRFPSAQEAQDNAFVRYMNALNADSARAMPSMDAPTHRFVDRRLVSIEAFKADGEKS
jgi:hypothetical protein